MKSIEIHAAQPADFDEIWPIFEEVARAGDTYGYETGIGFEEARREWMDKPRATFIARDGDVVVGTYYVKTNHAGPGKHVCNCGYMVSSAARGRGVAAQMCEHSQRIARELGYLAMQFNFVAEANAGAVHLWKKLGFREVGRLPGAFRHPEQGLGDALVLHKWLEVPPGD